MILVAQKNDVGGNHFYSNEGFLLNFVLCSKWDFNLKVCAIVAQPSGYEVDALSCRSVMRVSRAVAG